ncbi:MAG: 1-acyl-sn-glycerol-3-phosphate acyltransferase [Chlorobi bacterium]|nr:1-acyl-sn-glycerol-3-phosphate acyltransferase [Chlorobiota bacterium]
MIKILRNTVVVVWKLWTLVITYGMIVVFSPLVLLTISLPFPTGFRMFSLLERLWARLLLMAGGWRVKIMNPEKRPSFKRQYIVVANHESMLDIPVMLRVVPAPLTFIGKIELARYPLFGYLYRRTNILVDRSSLESRKKVYEETEKYIRAGINIGIFPEGGIIEDDQILHPFKAGAFKMALEHGLPILPVVFLDNKKHLSYDLFKGSPGKLRVKFLPPVEVKKGNADDWRELRDKVYTLMYNELAQQKLMDSGLMAPEDKWEL